MKKIFPTTRIKGLDTYTIENEPIASIDLMERASQALVRSISERWNSDTPFMVFAGPGNNGGDAFAISEESVHEAGCIHTSQGLEFDYVGVIIGDDMRFENGKVITDYTKRARTDNSLKGIKTLAKKDKEKADQVADEIIKNTYRTLMTRGMKGCYVYCTDTALAQYLKKLLKQK